MGFSLDCPMLRNGTPTERVLDPCPRVSSECLWCACGQTVWHTSGGYGSREKLLSRPCEASYGLPLGQPRGSYGSGLLRSSAFYWRPCRQGFRLLLRRWVATPRLL